MLSCTCQGVLTQYGNIWQRHQNQLLHVLLRKRERKIWGVTRTWLGCSVCPPAQINNMETFHQVLWWKHWTHQVKNHFSGPRWRKVQQDQNLYSSNFEIPPEILHIYSIYNQIWIISQSCQTVKVVHMFVTVGRALGRITQLIMAEVHVAASFSRSR